MRPGNITEKDIVEWELLRQLYINSGLGIHKLISGPPPELWYAGLWLRRELVALHCPEDISLRIAESSGQILAFSPDKWQAVQKILEDYKNGIWQEPGKELAQKLFRERYGDRPDALLIISDMTMSDNFLPDERAGLHDAVFDATGKSLNDDELMELWIKLPCRIQDLAEEWGFNDTEFREKIHVWLKEQRQSQEVSDSRQDEIATEIDWLLGPDDYPQNDY